MAKPQDEQSGWQRKGGGEGGRGGLCLDLFNFSQVFVAATYRRTEFFSLWDSFLSLMKGYGTSKTEAVV